jgi:hypothetical protein
MFQKNQRAMPTRTNKNNRIGRAANALLLIILASAGGVFSQQPSSPVEDSSVGKIADEKSTDSKPNEPKSRPSFKPLRFEEDYGYLQDKSERADFFDRFKYIPLRRGKADWYASIGGEIRPYFEIYENNDFGRGAQDGNGYLLQRYMLHADFRFGQRVRVFVQVKSGVVADKSSPIAPPDVNKLDVNSLFVDFNFGLRKAEKDAPSTESPNSFGYLPPRLTLRVGRQELNFGAGRVVSFRNGPNTRQAHDGISLIWRVGKWRIDAVATKPVGDSRGYFDDRTRRDQTFWAIHASHPFPFLTKAAKVDVYYFGFDRKFVRFDQGAARDIRQTFGARFYNGGKRFDYDVEFTGQLGRFGDGNIRAWAISPTLGYTFLNTKLKPRIGFDGGIVSGDRNPNDKNLNTFAPPFPRGQYFGLVGANGAYNIQGFRPSLKLNFPHRISVTASSFFFWRQSIADGLYNVPGILIRTGRLSRARFIGQSPEIEMTWQVNRNSTLQLGVSKFYAGRFLRETPPDKNIGYAIVRYTFQF